MEEDFLNNELIDRFEQMLEEKMQYYFDTEDFYEIIAYYLDVGDTQFAKKALDYAISLHPDNLEIKIKKAEYYLAINRLKSAESLINELKDVAHNDLDFILCQAKFWELKSIPNKAIVYYKKALELEEDLQYIYNCIGNVYQEDLYEFNLALYYYKKSLNEDLDSSYALYSCVQCYDRMYKNEACVEFLNQYIDHRPYSEVAWTQLGIQNLSLKRYKEAHRAFDFAVIINPKSIMAHSQKAQCLEKTKDYEEAIKVYEDILELNDSAAFTYLKIGACYEKLGKPFKALNAYHKSLLEDPQLDKVWIAVSDVYESIGSYEEAMHYLEKGLDLDSSNVDYWKRKAYLNIQLGMYEESSEDYYRLVKLEPNNFYNWLGLVETLTIIGDYDKTIETIQNGLEHFNRAELYYQLSNCYYLLNEEAKGAEAFEQAKKIDPSIQIEMLEKYPILKNKYTLNN